VGATFELNHGKLGQDLRFAEMAQELAAFPRIDSKESFNRYAREAIGSWNKHFGKAPLGGASAHFRQLLARVGHGGEGVIRTPWGGVVIIEHQHPRVEKYLVIRKGGFLALEKHAEKDERLEVEEGAGLLLWRQTPDEPLTVEAAEPGRAFHFEPGMEHCLIGTGDLLVLERSIDPRGMDQDLIFIYEPEGN
jgi:hypothetical protein